MKLYNTLSRQIDVFEPLKPPHVGLYACGLTVYDFTHLGHLRKYTMDDVLIRTFKRLGYQVKFVQNITDVGHLASDGDSGEDKLEKGARKYGKSAWDVARDFEDYFWKSMDAMGNLRPDVSCRATEHIEAQLELVKTLEKKGFTYVIENDGVYFDTSKLEDYAKLALVDIEQLREGARIEMIAGKKHATDFALWKFERPGENRAMVWPSPWAERSFPGWHIECSAMSMQYLGEQFDVHTGGIDHINVHHTNEIAQAEAATDKVPFVKYWVHHNHLFVDGVKMSKSLGNFFTIDDVIKRGYSTQALRLLFLTGHYRSEMNFTWENLAGTQKSWERLVRQVVQLKQETGRTMLAESKLETIDDLRARFVAAVENDLDTPTAVALIWETIKTNIPSADKYDLLIEFDEVLGLGLRKAEVFLAELTTKSQQQWLSFEQAPAEIQNLLTERETARRDKEWGKADEIRTKLTQAGFVLKDTAEGQRVMKIDAPEE